MSDNSTAKIPLPAFLKMLTNHNIPPSKAMTVAGKIYKTHNTPHQLSMLTDFSLESAGITEKELRKQVLAAVRKAGYKGKASAGSAAGSSRSATTAAASTSKAGSSKTDVSPPRLIAPLHNSYSRFGPSISARQGKPQRKRKRDEDLNELLPNRPRDEGDVYGSLEFNEILDEEVIKTKYAVVNRAPIMMAWAFIVAERLGFGREEALSIASVYTEMNAVTKGVSLGIYKGGSENGKEASRTGSQPYVELMGRRPLYQTASSQWHALSSGQPSPPTKAFSYITRALRQTAPYIVGALRLLAASYPPVELNKKGFSLYAEFRPAAEGWGQKGEVRCSSILALRKASGEENSADVAQDSVSADKLIKMEPQVAHLPEDDAPRAGEPAVKRLKMEPPEVDEYDAALDDDALFNDFDLSTIP
ncbi:hypothetical protein BN946_scf184908.g11 [Trametes cinnabarina]|uniref:Uncharacterized protein n=1 Tax=Pycnoporus cinnabarinus TaxID=5643 RepID=A0A060SG92_PYCCI|nr:hypothetical protein BN946_scf184908.g11 [Trametes cinnabarina]